MNLGENIRNRREELSMTQQQLADEVGVSRPLIAQIERGTRALNVIIGLDIAKALHCELNDIISGKGA